MEQEKVRHPRDYFTYSIANSNLDIMKQLNHYNSTSQLYNEMKMQRNGQVGRLRKPLQNAIIRKWIDN